MPEFLLELGCEELPASFVQKAYNDLLGCLTSELAKSGVLGAPGTAMGTPRRLIVSFPDLADRQKDSTKEQRGPALKAAFGPDGNPTPALLGFCRSQGVDPNELRKDDQYVWVTKKIAGRNTRELLAEVVPMAIRGLTFDKTMRWGASRTRFARPIRWILAAFDGQTIDLEFEGVRAGLASRGHRFYAPEPLNASRLANLLDGLRKQSVEPDPEVRRKRILEGARTVGGASVVLTDALVDENVFLTEWPTAIQGEFRAEYQALPEPVLITAMAKHERMFPVRDDSGKLTNRFVAIRNSGEDESVRRGNEWVLNARFNDAKFFFDEDAKYKLADFLERTANIVFQEKLGTVRQRADRLGALAAEIARSSGAPNEEIEFARQAGLYCKADLATGLVSEFASLQGVVGGEYARREDFPDPVCWAIASHYDLSRNPSPDCSGARTAVRVTMADALDKLAGYLGLGLEPSGSSDPYALRRAASNLIEAAWSWRTVLPSMVELFSAALTEFDKQGIVVDTTQAIPSFVDVFVSRYATLLPDVRHDILEAAILREIPAEATTPKLVVFRARCLEKIADDVAFIQTATRPMNIVISARKKGIEYGGDAPLERLEHAALESKEGVELFQLLSEVAHPLGAAREEQNVEQTVRILKDLEAPITRFFESTMVMDDQPDVRYARLTLMHACSLALLTAGDFTKLVIEGGA